MPTPRTRTRQLFRRTRRLRTRTRRLSARTRPLSTCTRPLRVCTRPLRTRTRRLRTCTRPLCGCTRRFCVRTRPLRAPTPMLCACTRALCARTPTLCVVRGRFALVRDEATPARGHFSLTRDAFALVHVALVLTCTRWLAPARVASRLEREKSPLVRAGVSSGRGRFLKRGRRFDARGFPSRPGGRFMYTARSARRRAATTAADEDSHGRPHPHVSIATGAT